MDLATMEWEGIFSLSLKLIKGFPLNATLSAVFQYSRPLPLLAHRSISSAEDISNRCLGLVRRRIDGSCVRANGVEDIYGDSSSGGSRGRIMMRFTVVAVGQDWSVNTQTAHKAKDEHIHLTSKFQVGSSCLDGKYGRVLQVRLCKSDPTRGKV